MNNLNKFIEAQQENYNQALKEIRNDYLRNNLLKIPQTLLDLNNDNPTEILVYPDDLKVKSCIMPIQASSFLRK